MESKLKTKTFTCLCRGMTRTNIQLMKAYSGCLATKAFNDLVLVLVIIFTILSAKHQLFLFTYPLYFQIIDYLLVVLPIKEN